MTGKELGLRFVTRDKNIILQKKTDNGWVVVPLENEEDESEDDNVES
jgi:hypothetical protein